MQAQRTRPWLAPPFAGEYACYKSIVSMSRRVFVFLSLAARGRSRFAAKPERRINELRVFFEGLGLLPRAPGVGAALVAHARPVAVQVVPFGTGLPQAW